jgi:hypothetical protein
MKKIFVEYNAYLSDLYKREENVGKSEKELILENKLYERAYTVTKCGPRSRQKLNLDYTPYYVKPVLSLHGNKLSDIAYFNDDCIGILVNENELETLNVPFSSVYILEQSMVRGAFYKRTVDNIYLMESLDNEELNTLSKEESAYYNNFVNKPKFAKEVNEDGTISLVALHDENSNLKKYVECDENYPESMAELISYLKVNSKENFVAEDLPLRAKKHRRLLKR